MAENDVQVKVGMVPDSASNKRTIDEILRGKRAVEDFQKSVASASKADSSGIAKGFDKATASIQKADKELAKFRQDLVQAAEEAKNVQTPDAGKGGGFTPNKFRGAASLIGGAGAGEAVGMLDDIMDAKEGLAGLGGVIGGLNPVTGLAIAGIAAVALAMATFAQDFQKQADAINQEIDAARSVADQIAGGATKEDIQASIDALKFRREMEKQILAESQDSYNKFIQGIRDAFGPLAGLVEGIVKIIAPQEEALASQIDKSNKLIKESEAMERQYTEALEKGLTAKADAAKAETERQKAQEKAQREQEQADRKAAADAEKAQREAEARAKEQAQLRQQQEDMAIKYADNIKKINQGALDNIKDINQKAKDAFIDGRNKLITDLNNIAIKANDAEIDAAIKANRAEEAALKEHQRTIKDLMDKAADAEENARENRNFLQLAQARRDAQKELNKQPEKFQEGRSDRELALQQERDDRLRALEIARRDRKAGYDEEEIQRKVNIERSLRDNQTAKNRQLRDAATAHQQEQATFSRHLQNMLSLRGQALNAETQMLQAHVNAVTGGGSRPTPAAPSSVFNSSQTINNTTIPMTTIGMGSTLSAMRAAGFAR